MIGGGPEVDYDFLEVILFLDHPVPLLDLVTVRRLPHVVVRHDALQRLPRKLCRTKGGEDQQYGRENGPLDFSWAVRDCSFGLLQQCLKPSLAVKQETYMDTTIQGLIRRRGHAIDSSAGG